MISFPLEAVRGLFFDFRIDMQYKKNSTITTCTEVQTMAPSCCCRRLFPSEIAAAILAHLLVVATKRNEQNPKQAKILPTIQTDDPEKPGVLKIDVDYPTDPEKMAIRNHYLSRLEIDSTTGVMTFFPDGYNSDGETYALKDAPHILSLMCETIRTAITD